MPFQAKAPVLKKVIMLAGISSSADQKLKKANQRGNTGRGDSSRSTAIPSVRYCMISVLFTMSKLNQARSLPNSVMSTARSGRNAVAPYICAGMMRNRMVAVPVVS